MSPSPPADPDPRAAPGPASRVTSPGALALLSGAAAALVLVPGYGSHGLWSHGELPALQRAQAALGAAISGLERSPWLPDALRTQALALTGDPEAIRLPGALAATGLVALAAGLARALGLAPRTALLAGGFALASPLLLSEGRLAAGNAVGELLGAGAAVLGAAALAARSRARALALGLAGAALLGLSLLAAGLWLGVVLPLLAAALGCPSGPAPGDMSFKTRRAAALALALAAAGAAGVAGWLAYHQGEGYIPALAAARDLALRERPHTRGFTATLEEFGYQVYPWFPLVALGLLRPGAARWPALWLACGLALVSGWSLLYGPLVAPLTVPAAIVAAAAVAGLTAPTTSRAARRLTLALAVVGCLIFAKDARRTPSRVGAPLIPPRGEHLYPAAELGAAESLGGLAGAAALSLLLAAMLSRTGPQEPAPKDRSLRTLSLHRRAPPWLPAALVLAALGRQAWVYGRDLLPRTSEQLSLQRPLARYAAWVDAGALQGPLGVHRFTDPGLDLYGPTGEGRVPLGTRETLLIWLRRPEPAAALIRASELPPVHQAARAGGFPVHVLDHSNRDAVLVANVLPPDAADVNPIRRVLFDAPPELAHPTLIRFEDYVEVIGWEWDEPVVRGREVELRVALRPLRPLPSGAQIYVRLLQGRLSRVNPMPHELAENLYPPQYWRAGDYILHRFRVQVPLLEILPGPHDVVIGLRRSEHSNFKISAPEGAQGEHGVEVKDSKHEFAAVGQVQVW